MFGQPAVLAIEIGTAGSDTSIKLRAHILSVYSNGARGWQAPKHSFKVGLTVLISLYYTHGLASKLPADITRIRALLPLY